MPPGQVPPGQLPPPGQPGAFGPPPGIPEQPKKKGKGRLIGILIAAVVVIAAVVFGVVNFTNSAASAVAGDCLNVKEFKNNTEEPAKVDCNAPEANVKIGVKLDNSSDKCPGEFYDTYSVSGKRSYKLCLMINAKQGECWSNLDTGTDGYQRVPCTDPKADGKFVKVVPGTADEKACDGIDPVKALVYAQPPTTLCLTKPDTGA
ncbi:LppU/SCO3897 family protein [Amycolatopsis anabasis]|uniref:LppU/SCO3897 family protein n=1 Tax=Amycolatopsis anabasis TaxID=1840409 RepID=UPI001FE9812D|nr:hypothetical protein [Amycolatopsis anabasis]